MRDRFWLVDAGPHEGNGGFVEVQECSTWLEARAWFEVRVETRFVSVFDRDGKGMIDYLREEAALSFDMSAPKAVGSYLWSEDWGYSAR